MCQGGNSTHIISILPDVSDTLAQAIFFVLLFPIVVQNVGTNPGRERMRACRGRCNSFHPGLPGLAFTRQKQTNLAFSEIGWSRISENFFSWPFLSLYIEGYIIKSRIFPFLKQSFEFLSYKHLATLLPSRLLSLSNSSVRHLN